MSRVSVCETSVHVGEEDARVQHDGKGEQVREKMGRWKVAAWKERP